MVRKNAESTQFVRFGRLKFKQGLEFENYSIGSAADVSFTNKLILTELKRPKINAIFRFLRSQRWVVRPETHGVFNHVLYRSAANFRRACIMRSCKFIRKHDLVFVAVHCVHLRNVHSCFVIVVVKA